MNQPVEKGQEMVVRIESIARKGDGVVKINGMVVFVPGARKGERCRIRVTNVLERFAFAEKLEGSA